MAEHADVRIAVIGAGPVGIAAGRELLRRGFTNLTIFEKEAAVGGTWHMHSYPGLACDVKAHAYTFSYETNPDWSANYVGQAEIEAYLQRCAKKFGLEPHLRLNTRVTRARYQGDGEWIVETQPVQRGAAGHTGQDVESRVEEQAFDFVINAMGNQHTPIFPSLDGMDRFQGDVWHSTQWNHDVELAGKRIVVVGSAASAVQIVPELAKIAAQLTVLQRSPNWILPRGCKPYRPLTRRLLHTVPGLAGLLRSGHERVMNLSHGASKVGSRLMSTVENLGRKNIAGAIPDTALREVLEPKQRFGCQRPLVSDDFYPALVRENVTLVPSAAREVTETGIVTVDGQQIDADVIIYCTGYKILDFERIGVVGASGRSLAKVMSDAPEAFKGIAVPGFPNYFLGVGPNGVLLSASFFTAMEANVRCIVRLLVAKEAAGVKAISVKPDVHRAYNDWIHSEREQFSWGSGACTSYYRTPSGHTPFLFPGSIRTFQRHRNEAGLHEFDLVS